MAIKVYSYVVRFEQEQRLQAAQGEDVEYRLTFLNPEEAPIDMTAPGEIKLSVRARDANQTLMFARDYSGFIGDGSAGTPRFRISGSDTNGLLPGLYDVDVQFTDSGSFVDQVLVVSTFELLYSVGRSGDPVTSPPVGLGGVIPFASSFGVPAVVPIYSIPDGKCSRLRLTVSAARASDGAAYGGELVGSVKRASATSSIVGVGAGGPGFQFATPPDADVLGPGDEPAWRFSLATYDSGAVHQLRATFSVDAGTVTGVIRVEPLLSS